MFVAGSNMGNMIQSNNARGGVRSMNNSQRRGSYEENVPPSARSGINSIHGPSLNEFHRTGVGQINAQK